MKEETAINESMAPGSESRRPSTDSDDNWEPGVTAAENEAALNAAKLDPKQTIFWPIAQEKKLDDISVILLVLNRCIGMFSHSILPFLRFHLPVL
jgi:hypothetical protein